MLHAARRPRYFDSQDVSATESSSKRVKPSEEPYGKSYEGLQILREEIHVKKTHSGFIPLSLMDDETQEEKETTDILFNKTFSGNKRVSSKHLESIKNTGVTGNKCGLSNNTNAVHNGESIGFSGKHENEGETELYSTSTAFIGPIYKSEDGRQHDKKKRHTDINCQKVSGALSNGHYNKEMTPKYVPFCNAPKIEDELSQFYSEIDQLESNDNCLDSHVQATVTNLNEQPAECNKSIQVVCSSSREWSCRTSPNWGDGQCFYKEPSGYATGSEPYPYHNHTDSRNSSGQCCNNERDVCETEPLCNKQENSRFWNDSVPHFKPSWQPTAPFIIPCGPPPPQFATQFNLQETSSSPFHSHIFHSSNVGPFKNTHVTMSSSTPDQSNEFVNRFGTHNMQTARNGYNMSDGHVVNGFCETQGSWKDFKMCQNEGSSIVSQQIPETKFCESQKLLFILRGLPGSGKTTLSHILLGKSRDGIVFSTDDYFCQTNGCWSYNIALLGDAHDWNQKRAKEAMDHGRSPIIIDNTNTQAWEMKPYVEAALEKGYRVEFHEPDTWWKFNPEELEKRNEHGVSREKIVQMLERYEYQMSIPIVMNSVLPFHKTSQRPPPQRRQRVLDIKKNEKMKQRRKRKRNQKMKGAAIKAMGEKSNRQLTSSDEDSSQSGYEDSEGSGKPAFVSEHSNESKEGGEDGSANNDVKFSMLKKESTLLSSLEHPLTSGNSTDPDVLAGNSSLPVAGLPVVLKEHIIEQSLGDHVSNRTQSSISEESNMPEYSHASCSLKSGHNGTDDNIGLNNMKGKDGPTKGVVGLSLQSKPLSDKEEATILHHRNASQSNETNIWAFFSFDMVAKKPYANSDKSEFSRNWLEDTSKIIYDQRPKKVRKPKNAFSETTAELLDHGSSKEFTANKNDEVLDENSSITGGPVPSLLSKNTQEMPCTIIDYFAIESGTNDSGTSDVTTSTSPNKKGRSKRIFKLAPKFDVPRQIPVRKEEKMVKEVDVLMKEEISNEDTGENSKQSLGPPSSDTVIDVSQLNVEYLSCNNSKELVKQSVDSAANAAPVQTCPSVSFEALLPSEQPMVEANTEEEGDKVLPEVSTTQPDILYSVKDLSECLTRLSAETLENTQQLHETGLTVASQIKDNQDPLSAESSFLGLPLSLAFATQLVELFGSPGVSLETLLPDDYVVPLEWETSKEIYLQWKMSVEKKQKKNILKEEGSLTDAGDLEESNKDEGERDNSSEDNQKISLPETLF